MEKSTNLQSPEKTVNACIRMTLGRAVGDDSGK